MYRSQAISKLKPLPKHRAVTVAALDIGTYHVTCFIAELYPFERTASIPHRTHEVRVKGIGYCKSEGLRNGVITDLRKVEKAVCQAVVLAEEMAKQKIKSVLLSISGVGVLSQHLVASCSVDHRTIEPSDLERALEGMFKHQPPHRVALHSLPLKYTLDQVQDVNDPVGMLGKNLGVTVHTVSVMETVYSNSLLVAENAHLKVDAVVLSAYASGLSVLMADESDMGAVVIDMGAGTTGLSIFSEGKMVFCDVIPLGGEHITQDVAKGLNIDFIQAERLKTLYGAAIETESDAHDFISISNALDQENYGTRQISRKKLINIIRPRVEEILEILRDRLISSGYYAFFNQRIVLTGGASQLVGLVDVVANIMEGKARIGLPLAFNGHKKRLTLPNYATVTGLFIYAQICDQDFSNRTYIRHATGNRLTRFFSELRRWFYDNF